MTLLTIGIPTYNRAEKLEQLLTGILPACEELEIEVLVSDNCSTDNTAQVLQKYQSSKCLKVRRNTENVGFDRNFLKLIEHASGRFLWFMGDDDSIRTEHLIDIKGLLLSQPEPGLVYVNYASELDKRVKHFSRIKPASLSAQKFADIYLQRAALISANIINLSIIRSLSLNMACVNRGWINLHLLLKLLDQLEAKKMSVYVIREPVVIQGVEIGGYNPEKWERTAIDSFAYTLEQTLLKHLKTRRFIKHFYDLIIRPIYLTISKLVNIQEPLVIYRKIVKIFKPNVGGRISFCLQYHLLWKTIKYFQRNIE